MSEKRRKEDWSFYLEHMRVRAGQVVSDMMSGRAEVKQARLREARAGAASAAITIEFSLGHASIVALPADSPDLFLAQISYVGAYDFQVPGRNVRSTRLVSLPPTADPFFPSTDPEIVCADIADLRTEQIERGGR